MHKKLMYGAIASVFAAAATEQPAAAVGAVATKPLKEVLADWIAHVVDVSKKVQVGPDKNEYQKVGDVTIPLPTLKAFGIDAKIKEMGEDGLPVYEDDNLDWLFGAAVAMCKAQARNKLISGTADLKDGQKIAENFAELTAEGERKGNAEALKLAKEVQTSFAAYVQGLGKSAAAQGVLIGLFRNKQALALQADDTKTKFKKYLSDYAETLEQKDLERYGKYLTSVEESCAAGTPTDF